MAEDQSKPRSVLFVCTMNAVRSPMAAALLRHLEGRELYVESAGVHAGELDPMTVEVMAELDISSAIIIPRASRDPEVRISIWWSPFRQEAQHKAMELTRTAATRVEYWPTADPTAVEGARNSG